jgi:hypothetical protein
MISIRGLAALTVVTLALIAATWAMSPSTVSPRSAPGEKFDDKLTPERLNQAASLTVTAKAKSFTVQRTQDGGWTVKDMADYPADPNMVRKALFALSELRTYEAKTRDPKRLAKLDLDDPQGKDANAKQLTVRDKAGKIIADVIFGKSNTTNVVLGKEMVYVRRAGEDQAWLAEGDPTLKAEALDWVLRNVIDVDVERVREAVINDAKGELRIHVAKDKAEDKDFTLKNLPEGRKAKEARLLGYVAESIDNVSLDDVRRVADIDFEKNGAGSGTWRTFDGLVIHAKIAEQDKKTWIALTAEVNEQALLKDKPKADSKLKDADAVRKEAAEINARVKAWAYQVPTTVSRFLQYKLDDVLEEVKKDEKKEEKKDEKKE